MSVSSFSQTAARNQAEVIAEHTKDAVDKKNAVLDEINSGIGPNGIAFKGAVARHVSANVSECFDLVFNKLASELNTWSGIQAETTKATIQTEEETLALFTGDGSKMA